MFAHIFRLREFRMLLPPNLLRGVLHGVPFFLFPVGVKRLGLPNQYAAYLITAAAAASIAGSITIGLFLDRWRPGIVTFAGNILAAVGLTGVVLIRSAPAFVAFYWVTSFGLTVMGSAVPLGIYGVSPKDVVAAFDGARLIILSAFGALSMLVVGRLLDSVDARPVFVIAAALNVVNGYLYWRSFRRRG
jgi:MFS family permease